VLLRIGVSIVLALPLLATTTGTAALPAPTWTVPKLMLGGLVVSLAAPGGGGADDWGSGGQCGYGGPA
jgi:hypothetical protein